MKASRRLKFGASLLSATLLLAQQPHWQPAQPGYHFEFPRDHFNHPQFQTEWWYYTGNLRAADGHRFGFELTFFRQAGQVDRTLLSTDAWRPDQFYLAHFALSDLDGQTFYHRERLNRAGPGLAGASQADRGYWNGNWQVLWTTPLDGHQQLEAVTEEVSLHLNLAPQKQPVIHGENGISRKGPQPAEASHYISFTRLGTAGTLRWQGKTLAVTGTSWMDHEFFSEPPDNTLLGWDWFAIQLDNKQELMLYRLRRQAPTPDEFSSGTFIDEHGRAQHLQRSDFRLTPQEQWRSPQSKQSYPIAWTIEVPGRQLRLDAATALKNQELYSNDPISPTYWEGAVSYTGTENTQPVRGVGYLEMTSYGAAIHLGTQSPK